MMTPALIKIFEHTLCGYRLQHHDTMKIETQKPTWNSSQAFRSMTAGRQFLVSAHPSSTKSLPHQNPVQPSEGPPACSTEPASPGDAAGELDGGAAS